jgi:hypothetical protein
MTNGVLLQIVAYGAEDLYLTADPEITYFKYKYKRYTNFAKESIYQKFNNTPEFGKSATCTISRIGDLASNCFLNVDLPEVRPTNLIAGTEGLITGDLEIVNNGRIVSLTINNVGSNYSVPPTITIENANGIGALATAIMTSGGDQIASIILNYGGTLYKTENISISLVGGTPFSPGSVSISSIVNGVITGIAIDDPGIGYFSVPSIIINNITTGIGIDATAEATLKTDASGEIDFITITNNGQNYLSNTTLVLLSGGSPTVDSELEVINTNIQDFREGLINSIDIDNVGIGYTEIPTIEILNANGTGAEITVILDGDHVGSFIIVNPGQNYKASNITLALTGGGFITAAELSITSSNINNGEIISVTILNQGTGYTSVPTLTLSIIDTGVGINSKATAIINQAGQIASIKIENPGQNYIYTSTYVKIIGGGEVTTEAELSINISNIDSNRAGMIKTIPITSGFEGDGYLLPPDIIITPISGGVGFGAKAEAIIVNNKLSSITIIDPGQDYELGKVQVNLIGGIPVNTFRWHEKIGHTIIKNADILIGGQLIDKHYGEWFNIWEELTVPFGKRKGYNHMIGHLSKLYKKRISNVTLGENNVPDENVSKSHSLHIPLNFWFCREFGQAIPLISLQYHDLEMIINFRKIEDCIDYGPKYYAKIDTTYLTNPIRIGSKIVVGDTIAYVDIQNVNLGDTFIYFDYHDRTLDDNFKFKIDEFVYVNRVLTKKENLLEDEFNKIQFTSTPVLVENTLYPTPTIIDAKILVEYIYLDTDERLLYVQNPHEYIIEQLQHTGEDFITGGENKIKLNYNHPVKSIHWVTLLHENYYRKNWNNYTDDITHVDTSFVKGENPLINGNLLLNGLERFSIQDKNYFNLLQPYYHFPNIPSEGYNTYSFSLNPHKMQASGTCNFSNFSQAELILNYNQSNILIDKPARIFVFGFGYNILKIVSGMGGLLYGS